MSAIINLHTITGLVWDPTSTPAPPPTWHNFNLVTQVEDIYFYVHFLTRIYGNDILSMDSLDPTGGILAENQMVVSASTTSSEVSDLWLHLLGML